MGIFGYTGRSISYLPSRTLRSMIQVRIQLHGTSVLGVCFRNAGVLHEHMVQPTAISVIPNGSRGPHAPGMIGPRDPGLAGGTLSYLRRRISGTTV